MDEGYFGALKIFDGRNQYDRTYLEQKGFEYHQMGGQ